MQRTLTRQDYAASVVSVPPIALNADLSVNASANAEIVRHIESGGVSILLYGGNANLYHFDLESYRAAMKAVLAAVSEDAQIITSIGPDFGKAMAQAPIARELGLKNAMLLPTIFPSDPTGVANGVRKIAEKFGAGLVLYIKRENYIRPDDLAALIDEQAVAFVKYAVERQDPSNDPYLDAIISAVGTEHLASGMGETPIHDHLGRRALTTYTSGAVCIAPAAAMELLTLYKSGQAERALELSQPFLEFERVRTRLGGIQVLHDGIRLAGLADTGPLMPMLSNLPAEAVEPTTVAVAALKTAETAARSRGPAAKLRAAS
jgi:dihydrodipicolinate synthase/N-acetylneuraminate lyase